MLWIGERTRQLDHGHVAFLEGVRNPLGVKLGPKATPDEAVALARRLNPDRIPGRLTFIIRMGAGQVRHVLPAVVRAVTDEGIPVVWACDPMHGNTFSAASGRKTRRFEVVVDEVAGFFEVCRAEGVWPGGLHCELTGDDVTECLGGGEDVLEDQLDVNYTSACDPRLNARQSLDLAFRTAELLRA